MAGKPINDPLDDTLPAAMAKRVAFVRPNKLSTIRLMHDLPDTDRNRWYEQTPDSDGFRKSQPVPPVTARNEVAYFTNGDDAFAAMVAAIRSAQTADHFIYLLGWILIDDFPLVRGDASTTATTLFADASNNRKVSVRALLWDQATKPTFEVKNLGVNFLVSPNTVEARRINNLPTGAAIVDNRTANAGSHHQKVLVVNGSDGLVAFCGGIDINSDRIHPQGQFRSDQKGAPMHDVHCRIKGGGAVELFKLFQQRWLDHPDHGALDRAKGPLKGPPAAATPAREFVQIGRTFTNGQRRQSLGSPYNFAPGGEQTARRTVLKAIKAARRFIYIEDQYLVNLEARDALLAALPNIQHLTILIPDGSISDLPQARFRRNKFIAPLRAAAGAKVRVVCFKPPGGVGTYVHSKTWIFDDKFAVIGSMNCNRRGWTHDSEVVAGIFDEGSHDLAVWHFAHRLRVRLWARHLNMDNPTGHAALADGVASGVHFLNPPAGSAIAPYDENKDLENNPSDSTFFGVVDPDGG